MPVSFCTAEVRGSTPLGSTYKYADLQVKREESVGPAELIRGLVLLPALQHIPAEAVAIGSISALRSKAQMGRWSSAGASIRFMVRRVAAGVRKAMVSAKLP